MAAEAANFPHDMGKVWKTTAGFRAAVALAVAAIHSPKSMRRTGTLAGANPRNGLLNCSMQNLMERRVLILAHDPEKIVLDLFG